MKLSRIILAILLTVPCLAADDEKVFRGDLETVWDACLRVGNSEFTLIHSEKQKGLFTFQTGVSLTSFGFTVGGRLESVPPDKTRVTLHPQKRGQQLFAWGAGGRIMSKFLKAVEKDLAKKVPK